MSTISAIFQAIIQGLTEFLPVSSSGHLSLYQHFTGNSGEGALFFSAVLHLGTLLAVFIAFRPRIIRMVKEFFSMISDIAHKKFSLKKANGDRKMVVMIIVSTLCLLPFAIFKGWFESVAEDSSIFAEGLCFLYTAAILYMSTKCMNGRKQAVNITGRDSVIVGLFQGVALLPGVSRSGSTISAGLFCGFTRETAVEYSFILGIPAILAGCLSELLKAIKQHAAIEWGNCLIGFVVAAVVGLAAIRLINWLVKSDRFKIFAYYTLALGGVVLVIAIIEAISGKVISFA